MGEQTDESAVREQLRQWRQAHPRASWDEIETEVQRQIAGLQAAWMGELAGLSPADQEPELTPERPWCPTCGEVLRAYGQRRRTMLTRMGRAVPLERTYYVCPACETGVFPPR